MANKLRKSIAKKDEKLQEAQRIIFYEECLKAGTSSNFARYVGKNALAFKRGK